VQPEKTEPPAFILAMQAAHLKRQSEF